MKKLILSMTVLAVLLFSSRLYAQDEWGTPGGALLEFDDMWRSGLTTIGYTMEPPTTNSSTLGWPAQLHDVNTDPTQIGFLLTRIQSEEDPNAKPLIQVGYREQDFSPPFDFSQTFNTKLIFTKDFKLGLNTETPDEMLSLHDGSMFIDLEDADTEHSLGVVVRGQSRPLITAFDSRASMNDRFTSGPYMNAGMFGMLMNQGALTFSIKHDPDNYAYHKFKWVGSKSDGTMEEYMSINENGIVGIGTEGINTHFSAYKLNVKGGIRSDKIRVDIDYANWPDYVFADGYQLRSLDEVASFIDENKHLPDVPSAEQLDKEGADLAEMNAVLLRKIEEMTLYMLELKQKNEEVAASVAQLSVENEGMKAQLVELAK